MQIPYFEIHAFVGDGLGGNPAGVCPLERWLEVPRMQWIAAANNLAETAFFVGAGGEYELRWFTPTVEVDLCGHATLAAAAAVCERLEPGRDRVHFASASGPLAVGHRGDLYFLDFPARPPEPVSTSEAAAIAGALGARPDEVLAARDALAVFADEDDVRRLAPDLARVAAIERFAVIATAPGRDVDFVSRFFAPRQGVPEDPVTGSAHTTLVPYWAKRLARAELRARQLSQRGGELVCAARGDRVEIGGRARFYLEGKIHLP
jgi:PhzF family phenazine biosynthesis protein